MKRLGFLSLLGSLFIAGGLAADSPPRLAPLPAAPTVDTAKAELGRLLFFDNRLSGDDTLACATCHDPGHNWADGKALSDGYPGSLYFRNTPTVLNASLGEHAYWDGRLPMSDLQTLVRDHIAEAHFMQRTAGWYSNA